MRVLNSYGFPGIYCNDLQMTNLSPPLVERFLLPQYQSLASRCDGLILCLNSADIGLAAKTLRMDSLFGCAFDKRMPLAVIRQIIDAKLFVIHNYAYDDAYSQPKYRDGLWWNPIVQTYSRELDTAYNELAATCTMLIVLERPTLQEVVATRQRLCQESR